MVHPAVRPAAHACRQRREEGEHCPCKSACARADEEVEERSNSALRQPSVDLQACGAAQAAAAGGNQADAPSQGSAARSRLITCDGVQLSLSTWSQEAQASGSSMAQRDRLFAWGASVFDRIYGISTVVDGAAGCFACAFVRCAFRRLHEGGPKGLAAAPAHCDRLFNAQGIAASDPRQAQRQWAGTAAAVRLPVAQR